MREPICLTSHRTSNDQLLYFTSSSLTDDDQTLAFISDAGGNPNLWALDLRTGRDRQLTFNTEGALKSYVYFRGNPGRGLGKASVSLDTRNGVLYYMQGQDVCRVDLNGDQRVLATLPDDQVTAFTHPSADGRWLCVPTTDARALDTTGQAWNGREDQKPDYDIDGRVQAEGLCSYLRVFDTENGEMVLCERVPRAWITHVQFHPHNPEWILYNHEWPSDCGIRRVWLWDGHEHCRMRAEGDGRSRADWACHEVWVKDGQAVLYHGGYHQGPYFIGRVNTDGTERVEIALPEGYRQYGHFNINSAGRLVSDGYYHEADDDTSKWGGAWISVQDVNWETGRVSWTPICSHGSNWDCQDSHPHPIFTHRGDEVLFTSNREGRRAIYRVRAEMA